MELSTLVLGIVFILTLLFIWMKRAHGFFKRNGIPGPEPTPLFGIFPEYKKKGVYQTDMDLVSQYGNVVGIYHGHRPVVLVADPEMIESICISNFDKFRNRKVPLDFGPMLRKTVSLSTDGQWRFLRDQISTLFNPTCLNKITSKIVESSDHLCNNIEEKLHNEKDIDLHPLCLSFSIDSMCNCLFGDNINSYKDETSHMVEMIKKGWLAGNEGVAKPVMACAVCPAMKSVFSMLQYNAIPSDVRSYFTKLVTKHMLRRHKDGGKNDLMSFLMKNSRRKSVVESPDYTTKNRHNISSDYRLSETEIVANCLFFFLAGYDTTATTLVFLLYCLAENPDCQDLLAKEISNIKTNDSDSDGVEGLQYLDMIFKETLRMFPPYLRFGRCVEEDVVIRGKKFYKGTEAAFPVYAIHRNPKIFPNPDKFDPHRFKEDCISKRHPLSFIPFGAGPRDCFAQSYTKLVVKTAVVCLLQKYRFSLSSSQKDPPALSKKGIYLRPQNGVWLSITKRG